VIEELIALAREMREESAKGAELGLSEDEVAFYEKATRIVLEQTEVPSVNWATA
jgi:Domain of unknown function (DUF3387)